MNTAKITQYFDLTSTVVVIAGARQALNLEKRSADVISLRKAQLLLRQKAG